MAPHARVVDWAWARLGASWMAMLPPYNEHLVRDYGFMNLGMTLFFIVAAITLTPTMVRVSAGALFVFGLPHMVFHILRMDHMSAADATMLTITNLVTTVVLPAVVFAMAMKPRETAVKPPQTVRPASS